MQILPSSHTPLLDFPCQIFRYQAVFQQILRLNLAEEFVYISFYLPLYLCAKTNGLLADPLLYDIFQSGESASAYKQDVRCINLQEFLLGMLSAAFGRDIRDSAFNYFQECLLNPFAGNVPCNRRAVRLSGYLVYLIYINNPFLAFVYLIIGVLQQA